MKLILKNGFTYMSILNEFSFIDVKTISKHYEYH